MKIPVLIRVAACVALLVLTGCAEDSAPECDGGTTDCSGDCVNTNTDATNCGGCGIVCASDQMCNAGVCQATGCAGSDTMCGDSCVDTNTDGAHCGGCNNACLAGQTCDGGTCTGGDDCSGDGEQICGGECVNTSNDGAHCGGCNNSCGDNATCTDGVCACSGGLEYCNGECVNLDSSSDHCGACLNPCLENQMCVDGGCQAVIPEICNGEDDDLDGLTDEGDDGTPLVVDCANLCGEGTQTCADGAFTDCTAPAPTDEVCDEIDNDCDGIVDEGVANVYFDDFDGDGFGDPDLAFSTTACSLPDGPSETGGVYVENNLDCNDIDRTVNPDADEVCDEFLEDEDCDGTVNEDCECVSDVECGTDVGECEFGVQLCVEGELGECGGEGFVPPAAGEMCDGVDNDCDGETDEELADDSYEGNDTCDAARGLPDAEEAGEPVVILGSIYHGAPDAGDDVDWYSLTADEATGLCVPGRDQCGYQFYVEFVPPTGAAVSDWTVCIYEGECGEWDATFCTDEDTWDEEAGMHTIQLAWDGICGLDDSRDFILSVETPEGVESCEEYSISASMFFADRECL